MSIEAMKQALEALERGRSQIIGALVQQDQDEAISALRQAIAKNATTEEVGITDDDIWERYKHLDPMSYVKVSRAIKDKAIETKLTVKDRHISYVCPNCHWSLDRLSKPEPEQTRSEKLQEAGYTRRSKGWSKEQEPVAWIKEQELAYMSAAAGIGETEWKTNLGLTPEPGDVPLYTAPKGWVGLTEEDYSKDKISTRCFIAGAKWAEAKLREKNHG